MNYCNKGSNSIILELHSLYAFTDFNSIFHENSDTNFYSEIGANAMKTYPEFGETPIFTRWTEGEFIEERNWYKNIQLPLEKSRGLDDATDYYQIGYIRYELKPNESITLLFSVDEAVQDKDINSLLIAEKERLNAKNVTVSNTFYNDLLQSGSQFVVNRKSTNSASIIAGYHWFSYWERDTMIAMRGLTIATDNKSVSESILATFFKYINQGMIPNRFPDNSEDKIEYNTIDAISSSLKQSMERYENLVIMGQDIAEYGGAFKITDGFVEQFGKERVRNTPICESAVVSAAMGLSINGFKAIVEMQFADFVSTGFNPIVNLLAKSYYRWQENADVVIRMPCGGGTQAGPFYSQTNEAWFTKTPGLKVVYPAFPYDAKGLLNESINDPNPVLFFEHKQLYRSVYQDVPTDYYTIPLGKAALLKEGNQITIIAYGAAVHWALETLFQHPEIAADVLDLRTLQPLDTEAIYTSVKKTGRAIVLHEDSLFGGIASDISALLMENCFEYLDAPVKRVASLNTPIPFIKALEDQYLPKGRFEKELLELLDY